METETADRHEDRCPTCGKFVPSVESGEGYNDLPPGGVQGVTYLETYCGEACAEAKSPPAIYEDTPEFEAWEARQVEERRQARERQAARGPLA